MVNTSNIIVFAGVANRVENARGHPSTPIIGATHLEARRKLFESVSEEVAL